MQSTSHIFSTSTVLFIEMMNDIFGISLVSNVALQPLCVVVALLSVRINLLFKVTLNVGINWRLSNYHRFYLNWMAFGCYCCFLVEPRIDNTYDVSCLIFFSSNGLFNWNRVFLTNTQLWGEICQLLLLFFSLLLKLIGRSKVVQVFRLLKKPVSISKRQSVLFCFSTWYYCLLVYWHSWLNFALSNYVANFKCAALFWWLK